MSLVNLTDAQAIFAPKPEPRPRIPLDAISIALDDVAGLDAAEVFRIRSKTIERVRTLAAELLDAAGAEGIGFDDVRLAAQRLGILTGAERDRFLSFGSGMMQGLGAVVDRYRRSKIKTSARRRVAVYVHRKFRPIGERT